MVQPGADPSQIRMSCDGLDCVLVLSDSRKGALRTPAVSCTPDPSLRGLTSGEDGRKDVAIVSVSGNPAVGAGLDQPASSIVNPDMSSRSPSGAVAICSFDSRKGALRTPAVPGGSRSAPTKEYTIQTENKGRMRFAPTVTSAKVGAELLLPTSLGELRTALPQVYQISPNGTRSEVDAQFNPLWIEK